MTITGRFPLLDRAAVKICWRLGVRRAEMHELETSERAMRMSKRWRECARVELFNGHRPATIYQTRDKSSAKAIVYVDNRYVGGA